MRAATAETARVGDLVEAVESDVALTISVLRFANRSGLVAGGVASIPEAVEVLKPSGVLAIAGTAPSLRLLRVQRRLGAAARALPRPRPRHPARRRPDRPRRSAGPNATSSPSPRCSTTSAGSSSPACTRATSAYFDAVSRTPEQRLRDEREQLGIDHALVGGVLARRWNLPQRIAVAIERHHAEDADGLAAMVATADMVAHYSQGEAIAPGAPARQPPSAAASAPTACASSSTSCPARARTRTRVSEPCPLSARELDVLRHLSEGMVYKQIAGEMQLSVSTIRTHLHNVYGKIGAVDRAQAVLTARDRGWI